jgi:hypothetical protein
VWQQQPWVSSQLNVGCGHQMGFFDAACVVCAGRSGIPPSSSSPPAQQLSLPWMAALTEGIVARLLHCCLRAAWHTEAVGAGVQQPVLLGCQLRGVVLSCVSCGGPILCAVHILGACCIFLWGYLLCGILSRPFVGVSLASEMPGRCAVVRVHMQPMWGHGQRVRTCLRVQTCAVL